MFNAVLHAAVPHEFREDDGLAFAGVRVQAFEDLIPYGSMLLRQLFSFLPFWKSGAGA